MNFLFRIFWMPLYSLWALRYIRRERIYKHAGLRLAIPPGVFHPGVFLSTPVFISFLQEIDFQDKTVLDVGTGSGLIALFAARRGALVTALDINPLACETARRNAEKNNLPLRIVESDLFDNLPPQSFDYLLINPPYFPRDPVSAAEHAFFAGDNFGYFEKLFSCMPAFMHRAPRRTEVWLIMSKDAHFEKIKTVAAARGICLEIVLEKKKWSKCLVVVAVNSELQNDDVA